MNENHIGTRIQCRKRYGVKFKFQIMYYVIFSNKYITYIRDNSRVDVEIVQFFSHKIELRDIIRYLILRITIGTDYLLRINCFNSVNDYLYILSRLICY